MPEPNVITLQLPSRPQIDNEVLIRGVRFAANVTVLQHLAGVTNPSGLEGR